MIYFFPQLATGLTRSQSAASGYTTSSRVIRAVCRMAAEGLIRPTGSVTGLISTAIRHCALLHCHGGL
ncbi:hypothetical protein KCP71_02995 [Salmonella enterica subsp. enterica]|nr:hypothetical protein KCP71_02995 [Salmonella enterica subsp. enterica]